MLWPYFSAVPPGYLWSIFNVEAPVQSYGPCLKLWPLYTVLLWPLCLLLLPHSLLLWPLFTGDEVDRDTL
jgi:hypothetical protein